MRRWPYLSVNILFTYYCKSFNYKLPTETLTTLGRRSLKKHKVKSTDNVTNAEPQEKPTKENPVVETQKLILDDKCIKKVGYLVKSPSKTGLKNKIARWQLRWFVLYDTQPHCDLDESCKREVILYYYKNHQEQLNNGQPLGKFDSILVSSKIKW